MKSLFITLAMSLLATTALADYQLNNCKETEYTRAQKILNETTAEAAQGVRTKQDLAMVQVYAAEIGLCANKISKSDACDLMIKNQEIVNGVGVTDGQPADELTFVSGAGIAAKLNEVRRLKEIQTFCGK